MSVEGEIVNQPPLKRLTTHDENVVLVLETAFHNGYNITEACQHADISRETYYTWLADDDAFSYRMSVAQSALNRKAKTNVFEAINQGDPSISLRYLTLRDPDFKPKTEISPETDTNKTREKIKDFLDERNPGNDDPSGEHTPADTEPTGSEVAPAPTDIPD